MEHKLKGEFVKTKNGETETSLHKAMTKLKMKVKTHSNSNVKIPERKLRPAVRIQEPSMM